ncbi:MAG: STAS domain-containing protein [Bacteroidia bacterium]|nr:STAS domain-containing protein [Bacteroidia bacterium]NND24781.1 STAS domain-containing protein [Flavobacteriaceae bacterium]NNM35658.1 STAS domain-containing protein [Nitrosopumilus sp.]MBT8279182.1 STAS domain-containing protein [Bacteroidia bacterium]NNK60870.1 STAS domain-containing protein [Flavobacteriaceae bacterium]
MALKISEQNGTFFIQGRINTTTATNFKSHFKFLLETNTGLTLNIDAIEEIDVAGLNALYDIYNQAIIYKKKFYIVGNGCKEIYNEFKQSNQAA